VLALGIILILLAVGAFLAVLGSGTDEQATLFGGNVELPTLVVFLAGAAAMLLFVMGLELVRSGVRRANTNRRTKKRLRTLERRDDDREVAGAEPDRDERRGQGHESDRDAGAPAEPPQTGRNDAPPPTRP
jgi:uncharacterized integral membrane protein